MWFFKTFNLPRIPRDTLKCTIAVVLIVKYFFTLFIPNVGDSSLSSLFIQKCSPSYNIQFQKSDTRFTLSSRLGQRVPSHFAPVCTPSFEGNHDDYLLENGIIFSSKKNNILKFTFTKKMYKKTVQLVFFGTSWKKLIVSIVIIIILNYWVMRFPIFTSSPFFPLLPLIHFVASHQSTHSTCENHQSQEKDSFVDFKDERWKKKSHWAGSPHHRNWRENPSINCSTYMHTHVNVCRSKKRCRNFFFFFFF